jgi:hypothetical protein
MNPGTCSGLSDTKLDCADSLRIAPTFASSKHPQFLLPLLPKCNMPAHVIGHTPNSWGKLNPSVSFDISESDDVSTLVFTGHIKPLLALYAHLAELRSADTLVLTLLSTSPMMTKIQRELELMSGEISQRLKYVLYWCPAF